MKSKSVQKVESRKKSAGTPANGGGQVPFVEPDSLSAPNILVRENGKKGNLEIPQKVVDAALLLEHWFKSQGATRWELMGVQSRNLCDHLQLVPTAAAGIFKCIRCGQYERL
jgi:hypothetical protein